jgi:nitrogen fixation-related uncharacterized protein
VKSGQYKDTVTPAIRILLDEPNEENYKDLNEKTKQTKEK